MCSYSGHKDGFGGLTGPKRATSWGNPGKGIRRGPKAKSEAPYVIEMTLGWQTLVQNSYHGIGGENVP